MTDATMVYRSITTRMVPEARVDQVPVASFPMTEMELFTSHSIQRPGNCGAKLGLMQLQRTKSGLTVFSFCPDGSACKADLMF